MKRVISVTFNDVTTKQVHFEDLGSLYAFATEQSEYWKVASEKYNNPQNENHQYLSSFSHFARLVLLIDSWKDTLEGMDDTQLNQQLNSRDLQRNLYEQISQSWLWSGHAFIGAFLECNKQYGEQGANSFFTFIEKNQINNSSHKKGFIGSLLAYEYELQNSDLTKRRNSEKASLANLRNQLDKTTQKLIGESDEFKDNFTLWDEATKSNWQEWLDKTSLEQTTQQDTHKNQHEEQQTAQKDEFISYMDGCKTRIAELESTYQEKLRLEKPATYWNKSAKKYGLQGSLWSIALFASILLGLVYFYDFFDSWLKGQALAIKLNTLQGAVIFGSILAVYAFLVKTISKLTFSSFHLMRDSEEREQLTYLYLSLNNDGQINESSRELILQALFSRSETGLLAGESGPTMPVNDLLKAVLKGK
ncbi:MULTISPECIES: DUF6161 domain-containing protein [unclassified Colwellia]|uniref:DUF6161 domain-containing protein n=1 Tax=unclassified Colwellia TaxID=196834 RepID=UPI0015F6097F|nr:MULTISPECIES: DUF6161 domain-containing protein [unclassified Colwellia]MBA6234061.1 hypothetical protein [Colwellia sp. MB02u-7]MBA6238017.1 hypothetical protein [Colwellia sp. MB02u-11]MBA6300735.1 hypothetical protein [Colwellia sp. MB3u-22]MBA6311366.1 hypothetical protein [Colwellia sp. MB3u-64]